MDGTNDNLLWNINDKVEIDSPGTEWHSYDKFLNSENENELGAICI